MFIAELDRDRMGPKVCIESYESLHIQPFIENGETLKETQWITLTAAFYEYHSSEFDREISKVNLVALIIDLGCRLVFLWCKRIEGKVAIEIWNDVVDGQENFQADRNAFAVSVEEYTQVVWDLSIMPEGFFDLFDHIVCGNLFMLVPIKPLKGMKGKIGTCKLILQSHLAVCFGLKGLQRFSAESSRHTRSRH